jgi:hypothetical protein
MASAEPWSLTWLEFLGVRVGAQDRGHEEPWGIRRIQAAAADVRRRPLDVVEDADEPGCRQVGAEGTFGLAAADELLDPLGGLGVELADPPGRQDRLGGLEDGVGVGDQAPARLDLRSAP